MASVPRPKLKWVRVESGIRKRTNHDGKIVYEVRVRRKGTPEQTLTCPTLREARKQRDRARSQAWEGKHIQDAEGRRKTVSELCAAFLKDRYGDRTDHSHYRTHTGHLRWWCGKIGELRVAQITPQTLLPYRSELLTLRWRDVDLSAGTVCFRNTRNGSDRTVTLVDPVRSLLRDRHRSAVIPRPESYVFPAPCGTRPSDIRTAWATAMRKAGLKDFHFHDLRHTTASYLRIDGPSLEDIGEVLGHPSLTVTRRYAHLDDSYQRKMLNATMEKVFAGGSDA